MKNLFIILLVGLVGLSSCKKEEYGQYHTEPENTNNTPDNTSYVYGGVLPNSGNATNELVGTKWVLTDYITDFATESPNDTLEFISINQYTLNGGAVRTYQLSSVTSSTNLSLSLYYFFPFGGSHYSANVGATFIEDGEINNAEFTDLDNETSIIKAWFRKI